MTRKPRSAAPAIFTIASANYIAHAAVLMQSVRDHHPNAARYIVLADRYREFPGIDLAAEILPCAELQIPRIENMQLWYNITEFNTAIKPFVFRRLFRESGHAEACYLDPDIRLFAPLDAVFAALGHDSCVLTPHMMRPLQDGKEPSDLTIMKSGVYNLGFLGLRSDPDVDRFLAWWAERCFAHCRIDIAANMFTDQRWMDLAPAFLERVRILRHPGYNVAYWNLVHRGVARHQSGWRVDGLPLVFFHFSGIDIGDPKIFSRHQNRFSGDELGIVGELCAEYRALVRSAGWERHKSIPYAFGRFANGRPIEDWMRRWLLRAVDDGRLNAAEPLRIDSNFFDAADETAAARGIAVTRAMYQFWLDRSDLQTVFDIYTPEGLEHYYNWFLDGNAETDGCDRRTVAAAEALRNGEAPPTPAAQPRRRPPWTPVANTVWEGAARDAAALLRSDVAITIENARVLVPRQAALMWELRLDLQRHYPLASQESFQAFLAWVLGGGIAESAIDPTLFSDTFLEQLARVSRLSLYYGDVPLTEGLLTTRSVDLGRGAVGRDWRRFPAERAGRLAHGLWFAFVAPKLFRWSPALAEPVRRWFSEETEIAWAGFRLSRAELAIWELRPDLQRRFPLGDPRSCWSYLHWLVTSGLREMRLSLDEFDPRLTPFLAAPSPRFPGLPQVLEMLHQSQLDLQKMFDISENVGRLELLVWADRNFSPMHAGTPAESLYPPPEGWQHAVPAITPDTAHHATLGLTGQWKAASGRGEDMRRAAEALLAAGFADFLLIDRERGRVFRADGSALPDGCRVELDTNIVFLNADTAFPDWCFLERTNVRARRIIGFWAWELERLPRYWRHAFSFYDEIWAATEFARAAFAAEGARPVKSVPLAVSLSEFPHQPSRAALGLPAGAAVFLFMFDFHSFASRKNPEGVIEAFRRAFPTGSEQVHLLLKTQSGDAAPQAWSQLNELCADPRIEIRDLVMEREDVIALIRSADAFVSLHRSEGFGRGPAEAMLLGKPVILTGYSGTADFASPDCAYVVDYRLKPVAPDEYPGVDEAGVCWADPDIDMAAAYMRQVYEDPKAARALGRRARARIAQRYAPPTVGAAMLAALGLGAPRTEQPAASDPPISRPGAARDRLRGSRNNPLAAATSVEAAK